MITQDEVKYTAFCSLWTSVDDALPVEPGRYLVCMDSANGPFIAGYHQGRGWEEPESAFYRGPEPTLQMGRYITHWMPLPGTYTVTFTVHDERSLQPAQAVETPAEEAVTFTVHDERSLQLLVSVAHYLKVVRQCDIHRS